MPNERNYLFIISLSLHFLAALIISLKYRVKRVGLRVISNNANSVLRKKVFPKELRFFPPHTLSTSAFTFTAFNTLLCSRGEKSECHQTQPFHWAGVSKHCCSQINLRRCCTPSVSRTSKLLHHGGRISQYGKGSLCGSLVIYSIFFFSNCLLPIQTTFFILGFAAPRNSSSFPR